MERPASTERREITTSPYREDKKEKEMCTALINAHMGCFFFEFFHVNVTACSQIMNILSDNNNYYVCVLYCKIRSYIMKINFM